MSMDESLGESLVQGLSAKNTFLQVDLITILLLLVVVQTGQEFGAPVSTKRL